MINSKVSIIIPVYNVESYLDRCLKSVVEQTYSNIEIIIVDDGSTDDSIRIAEKYSMIDSRILIYHKENGGLSSARNFGLSKMTGDYLVFLDSDDFISNDAIQTLMNCFTSDEIDISVGSAVYYYDSEISKKNNEASYKLCDSVIDSNDAIIQYFKDYRAIFLSACFKVYRKELFESIIFPVGKIHEDAYVFPLIYSKCRKIATTKEILFYYLQREGSITNSKYNDIYIKNELDYRLYLLNYFKNVNDTFEFYSRKEYCNALLSYGKYCSNNEFYRFIRSELKNNIGFLDKSKLSYKQKIKFKIASLYMSFYRLCRSVFK